MARSVSGTLATARGAAMNVGIVSQWRNQGQATLSRHLRDAVDALGHSSFVLARPTRENHPLPALVDRKDVWDQPNVDEASRHNIPSREYLDWARRHSIQVAFFNQNYQFKQIAKLRDSGVRTIGYFVWEAFRPEDVKPALRAYDVIYSLNRCTQNRYQRLGIDSPFLRWGCHPELLRVSAKKDADSIRLLFPGGLEGRRKPLKAVVAAFKQTTNPRLRMLMKAQADVPGREQASIADDPRIERIVADLSCDDYYELFASSHVCLGISRFEGTGLHIFEATAFGVPMIANDIPPVNEFIRGGYNGRLIRSHVRGRTKSGIHTYDPDVDDLAAAMQEMGDPATLEKLSRNALEYREVLSWNNTMADVQRLLDA